MSDALNLQLVKAVMNNDRTAVLVAIKAGADPATKAQKCVPVLFLAAAKAQLGIVRELIDAGADVKAKDYRGNYVLQYLASLPLTAQHSHIVKLLIDAGADPKVSGDHKNWPLETALLYGNYDAAKLMVEADARLVGPLKDDPEYRKLLQSARTP